jgi:hypothetical protein
MNAPRHNTMPTIPQISNPLRRQSVAALLAASLALWLGQSHAATAVVEIMGYAHPPVQSALKPLREWLATQGAKVSVTEIDMDSPQATQRLQALGLKGHLPVLVLVNGQYKHTLAGGKAVSFVGFPAGGTTPSGAQGSGWTLDDVKAVLGQ